MSDGSDTSPTAPSTITVRKGNTARDVSPEQLADFQDEGWQVETPEARADRTVDQAQADAASPVDAAFAAGLRGATFGGSDAIASALGGEDARVKLRHLEEHNPFTSMAAELGGSLLTGGAVGKLGKAAETLAGGSKIVGLATEGAAYGLGGGVSQLALSDDPLTAERALHVLGTDALMGAGIGGGLGGVAKLGSKALGKAGALLERVGAARGAIDGLPEDLAGLDEKGLRAAADTERETIKAAAKTEEQSLEAQRVVERAQAAKDVEALHRTLAEDSPIFHAVNGEDVEKIAGVTDIQVGLAKSFGRLRAALDNPIGVAERPTRLVDALQIRQSALEKLQPKIPELMQVLGGDARAAGLGAVDDALAQTKEQIARIKATAEPVMSEKLAALKGGTSPRLDAIEKAIEAQKNAPQLGLVAKGAKAAAFAGFTALAHAIPGVGMASLFIGKAASEAVGKLFTHLASGVTASAERSAGAFKALMGTGEKLVTPVRRAATEVLASTRFAPGPEPKSSKLADVYAARSQELRSQTQVAPDGSIQMRPEARQALGMRLAPISQVMPTLSDKLETTIAAKIAYLSQALPKHPEIDGLQVGPDKWKPSELEIRAFARKVSAAEDPHGVEERLAAGHVTPEEIEAYKACYPARYKELQTQIASTAPQLNKTLPTNKKVAIYVFTGVPTMAALVPRVLKALQANFAVEPGSSGGMEAPKPAPNFGALGSLKDLDKPTASQARE